MLAIATSTLFVLYILLPQLLFTFILSKFVPLRNLVRTKMEEVTDVLFFLFIIFFLVYFLVWFIPPFTHFPFGFNDTSSLRRLDYKVLVDDFTGETVVRADRASVWSAFGRCARRQGRVLSWYYIFIVGVAVGSGWAAKNYGKYQKKHPRYRWLADTFLIPNLSEWYPLLTNFTIKDKGTRVKVDILCDDTLYQGFVQQYFLHKDGGLAGVILTNPRRFDRPAYLAAKAAGTPTKRDDYWREIPSAKGLYFFADHISNLNINYDAPQASKANLEGYLTKLLREKMAPATTITVQVKEPDKQAED